MTYQIGNKMKMFSKFKNWSDVARCRTMDVSFIFTPIYSLGNLVGRIVATVVLTISGVILPDAIVDTVGLLTIVTLLLILSDMARKFAWSVVYLCWGLIVMKIGLLMLNSK
jgi:hypothetical protein